MNRNNANNPVVSARGCRWRCFVPAGFNPNHAVGTNSNNYPWVSARGTRTSVVPNWACLQRQLRQWWRVGGVSFRSGLLGGQHPRHVGDAVVFAPGQADADARTGERPCCRSEKINADGSIEISESNAVDWV